MRIGVDLGGSKIEVIALDAAGHTRLRRRMPTPVGDYDATLAAVVDLVAWAEAETGARTSVGVGTPGAISPATGRINLKSAVNRAGSINPASHQLLLPKTKLKSLEVVTSAGFAP